MRSFYAREMVSTAMKRDGGRSLDSGGSLRSAQCQNRQLLFVACFALVVCSCFGEKAMLGKPFVKRAGGKGQLLEQLALLLPPDLKTREEFVYVEPFVGGGAMLFYMLSNYSNITHAVINDLNGELVATYKAVRDRPEELILELSKLQEDFYGIKKEVSR